jgi:hypothetical protein
MCVTASLSLVFRPISFFFFLNYYYSILLFLALISHTLPFSQIFIFLLHTYTSGMSFSLWVFSFSLLNPSAVSIWGSCFFFHFCCGILVELTIQSIFIVSSLHFGDSVAYLFIHKKKQKNIYLGLKIYNI